MDSREPARRGNYTPLLDTVGSPAELRRLPESELGQLADELRRELVDAVSVTGG
ncbi:MAG TPA: 1-deoxy-D-xylulose-5-phosphate synthase N-terminal domain-containing protein, partial [Stellaceae bacterium]|nr:1-deoxy-D-xylulose-5-phosphate synthase N-terminal domain-containing protein [Stellaceae bacterium]